RTASQSSACASTTPCAPTTPTATACPRCSTRAGSGSRRRSTSRPRLPRRGFRGSISARPARRSRPASSMHVLVPGAGAVGGYFGARLAEGGHDVTLVARGTNLEALRRDGLTLQLPGDIRRLPRIRAVGAPGDAPSPDLVLVCVKSYDTAEAARALRDVIRPDTIVLSLQNGVENEAVLASELQLPPLLVGLTFIGVALVAPATVHYTGRGEILFGEPDGSESPRARRLSDAFTAAVVPFQLRRDILVVAWEKLAWNAGFNAVTTL